MVNTHLAILKKPYLDAILAGRKTIESRFRKNSGSPIGQVHRGDILFFKISSGPVCAKAVVSQVEIFQNLTPEKVAQIKREYNQYILGDDEYWRDIADRRVGFLAWLEKVEAIPPVRINKKDWRAWVVLSSRNNYGLFDNRYLPKQTQMQVSD